MKNPYIPEIKKDVNLSGIATQSFLPGQIGLILTKAFIDSYDQRFDKYSKSLLLFFISAQEINVLDRLLVVIKPDNSAYIYRFFPMQLKVLAKKNFSKGSMVTSDNIADISEVLFQDDIFKIDLNDYDRIIFLIREGHRFGLYFDLSGKATNDFRAKDIAYQYKKFIYKSMFDFLEIESNLDLLFKDGWFPFIRIIGSPFENLVKYYSEDKKYENYINSLIDIYTPEVISNMLMSWWNNPIFKAKKDIIEEGVKAYNQGSFVNCIKNLATEIEGIIRVSIFVEKKDANPKMKDIKDFLVSKGVKKFNDDRAFGFPMLFSKYLDESIFAGFDVSDTSIVTSRHSVGHGVVKFENYTKIRAFQLILTLDQIFYYL